MANTKPTSSQILYKNSIANSVLTTVQKKLEERVSVKDFGAVGDGVADDTAAIQAALNQVAAHIHVPQGRYRVTSQLTRQGNTLISGDGQNSSIFVMEGNAQFVYAGGVPVNHWDTKQIYIERMSFIVNGATAKHVIDISYIGGAGNTEKTAIIRDVKIQGTGPHDSFGSAIRMRNATNAVIDTVTVCGDVNGPPLSSSYGILMEGDAAYSGETIVGGAPVDITIENTSIYFVMEAIHITGWVEGVHVNKCTFVQVSDGIKAQAAPGGRPYIDVISTHINSSSSGIETYNFVQCNFSHNLIYTQQTDAQDTSYAGIQCAHDVPGVQLNLLVTDNTFFGIIDTPKTAIVVGGSGDSFGKISGNLINSFDTGIWLQSGTSNMLITSDNRFVNVSSFQFLDQGTANFVCGESIDPINGSSVRYASGYVHKFGTSLITLDASGNGSIPLSPSFQTQLISAIVVCSDPEVAIGSSFSVRQTDCTAQSIAFSVRPNPGAILTRVNWTADGR